jgi:hypothetical protein
MCVRESVYVFEFEWQCDGLWSGHKEHVVENVVDELLLNITCDITTALPDAFPDIETLCTVIRNHTNVCMAFSELFSSFAFKELGRTWWRLKAIRQGCDVFHQTSAWSIQTFPHCLFDLFSFQENRSNKNKNKVRVRKSLWRDTHLLLILNQIDSHGGRYLG